MAWDSWVLSEHCSSSHYPLTELSHTIKKLYVKMNHDKKKSSSFLFVVVVGWFAVRELMLTPFTKRAHNENKKNNDDEK